jgi:cation diffusion facilitator CzcD-associated flavoprotein CzcO
MSGAHGSSARHTASLRRSARHENDSGLSSAYASLRTNTSRLRTGYRCYPLPRRGPLFLHHTEMLAYLEAFTDHFGLREHIRFRTKVTSARPAAEGGWAVETETGERERFGAVLVAVGWASLPRYPDLPGEFEGLELHSHDYRTPEPFAGLDTVVVGLGHSAAELACEIRKVARSVTLSVRSTATVFSRWVWRIPLDLFVTRFGSRLPWSVRERMLRSLIRLAVGDQATAGLPPAPPRLGGTIAVTDELIGAARSGEVQVRGAIAELAGDRVRLADGTELRAQAILYGTGYLTEFPFLSPDLDPPTNERAALYRGVASPSAPGLFFIGFSDQYGAAIPVWEAQANWAADVVAGAIELPPPEVMRQSIRADAEYRRRNFDPAYGRAGIFCDGLPYARALERESKRARRRPGLPPRAAGATVR